METLQKLRSLSEAVPSPPPLPSEEDVKRTEEELEVTLPPSYKKYQLEYSNLSYGTFEPFLLLENRDYPNLVDAVQEARENGLPEHLLPFVEDNADYYCFDLTTEGPEYGIRYWSHNGLTNEKWLNFLDWVERCWMEEE